MIEIVVLNFFDSFSTRKKKDLCVLNNFIVKYNKILTQAYDAFFYVLAFNNFYT